MPWPARRAARSSRSPSSSPSAGGSTTCSGASPRPRSEAGERGMHNTLVIFRRELAAYFTTPLAYVFIVIFLALAGAFTFYLGNFFERGQSDLQSFFLFHPWLFLILIPAVGMRLWAEERKSGTIELLMPLPVTTGEAVIGKFLAAWCFTTI